MFLLAKWINFSLDYLNSHTDMKTQRSFNVIVSLVFAYLAQVNTLCAQSKISVDVGDPAYEQLKSPDFKASNSKSWDKKDWLEIEVEFEIDKVAPADAKFADALTVKWYVVAKSPESKGYVLMEKEVEHINIPVKGKVFSSVYLSPSSILRLSDNDRASEKVIERVGGEILFNGQRVGAFSSQGDAGWWQSGSLSRYDKIPLLSKDETPFQYFWWDRYAEIKSEKR